MASQNQLLTFLHAIGVNKNHVEYSAKGWTRCHCPLAPFTHSSGKDSNPSFGISEFEGKLIYNCFSCGSGTLEGLINTLDFQVSRKPELRQKYNIQMARDILNDPAFYYVPLPEFEEALDDHSGVVPWDEHYLALFPKAFKITQARNYLEGRGVTEAEAEEFDIRFDTIRQHVCFPLRDVYGQLAGLRGRSIDPNVDPKYKHYDHTYNELNNSKKVFFNEPAIASMQPVVVVEGQFDVLRVQKVYPFVLGNLTAGITDIKLEKLLMAEAVFLILDNDETGHTKTEKVMNYLYRHNQSVQSAFLGAYGQDPAECSLQEIYDVLSECIDTKLLTKPV